MDLLRGSPVTSCAALDQAAPTWISSLIPMHPATPGRILSDRPGMLRHSGRLGHREIWDDAPPGAKGGGAERRKEATRPLSPRTR